MDDQKKDGLTYAQTGVDYGAMDPFKREALIAALDTAANLEAFGFEEVEESRGESAYLFRTGDGRYSAHVEEGLGTKNLVADAMYLLTGKSYYDQIAQDCVAMIVNDMITSGARPATVAMHLAAGASSWFDDRVRRADLIRGWKNACMAARCTWSGGETPTLSGIVNPDTVMLGGSATGFIQDADRRIMGNIEDGDAIIMFESNGINANGLTMARKIAERLPEGYLTRLPNDRTYGESLLDPTIIYVPLIADLIRSGVEIHYAVNVTGHGWRKLMRHPDPFAYVIERLPLEPPIFRFLQEHGPIDDREAYGNLNMGAGFAIYVPRSQVKRVWDVLEGYPVGQRFRAVLAGHVEKSDVKRVVIKPKGLVFEAASLGVGR